MLHCIARILDPLLRLLWPPPPGRHRPSRADALPVRTLLRSGSGPRSAPASEPYFRGEDSPLVRPYLVAHERREARAQGRHWCGRRRVLRLAVRGIDIGPRVVHGRKAAV
ncbi:hypothetical protein [Streptomyces sp. NPDC090029]|uniref:hypothetical protein n=1 Tax=Streptomyces sp. NPDC090029 TaxID=3365924 RepID=UPI00380B5883